MADVIWPSILVPTGGGNPNPQFANVAGPASQEGQAQVIATDAGFWQLKMVGVPIYGPRRWRAWNATRVALNGRANSCLVPIQSQFWAPWPNFYGKKQTPPKKSGANIDGRIIYCSVDGAGIPEGENQCTIRQQIGAGTHLEAGVHFSFGERLFVIMSIQGMTKSGGTNLYSCTVWPPAREAVGANERIEFDQPAFRARLASDDEMNIDPDLAGMGAADVNWVEDT